MHQVYAEVRGMTLNFVDQTLGYLGLDNLHQPSSYTGHTIASQLTSGVSRSPELA
jgi:hypothetical protein